MSAPTKPGTLRSVACRWDAHEGRWRCLYTFVDGSTAGEVKPPPRDRKQPQKRGAK